MKIKKTMKYILRAIEAWLLGAGAVMTIFMTVLYLLNAIGHSEISTAILNWIENSSYSPIPILTIRLIAFWAIYKEMIRKIV